MMSDLIDELSLEIRSRELSKSTDHYISVNNIESGQAV